MTRILDDTTRRRIGAAIERLGAFASIAPEAIAITPLSGSSKAAFALATPMGRFVLRLSGQAGDGYLDPAAEFAATRLAHEIGLGAELVDADAATGALLLRFVEDGATLAAADLRRPPLIREAARALAALHGSGRDLPRRFSPWSAIERYRRVAAARGLAAPEFSPALAARLEALRVAWLRGDRRMVPAHCDPVPANFIACGDRLVLIDWEYAAMNHPAWDLAYLAVEAAFGPAEEAALLAAYGEPSLTAAELAETKIVVAAVDCLWALASAEAGAAGEPMRRWAEERRRLAEALAAP
jgi:thiamine kinase